MLAITMVNAHRSQAKIRSAAGYLHHLDKPAAKKRGFGAHASGDGPALTRLRDGLPSISLEAAAKAEQVERLARGLHSTTCLPLAKALASSRVAGLGMAFSGSRDVSAVLAAADAAAREAILDATQRAARAALGIAEEAAATRRSKGGLAKQVAEAAIAALFQRHASRSGRPQLRVQAPLTKIGMRAGADAPRAWPDWTMGVFAEAFMHEDAVAEEGVARVFDDLFGEGSA